MTQLGHRGTEAGEEHDAAPQASSVDPAASMSLLTSLLANPLDAGYEHYREDHGSRPAGLLSRVAVFAVAVALGFGSVIAIHSLRHPANDVKADLKEQAGARSHTVEELSDEVQSLGRAIDDLSQSGAPVAIDGARDLTTATRPVSGPGIIVTLTDRSGPGKGSGAVRDQDVAMVVNAMWAAGAEAISVNGQRSKDFCAHSGLGDSRQRHAGVLSLRGYGHRGFKCAVRRARPRSHWRLSVRRPIGQWDEREFKGLADPHDGSADTDFL